MKEIPIVLFPHELKALRDGLLCLIVRPVEPQPVPATYHPDITAMSRYLGDGCCSITWCTPKGDGGLYMDNDEHGPWRCPLGQPGDSLWARHEHWRGCDDTANDQVWDEISRCTRWRDGRVVENLDLQLDENGKHSLLTKRPASEMPRWASRSAMELTDVGVKRVKEISEDEAIDGGVYGDECMLYGDGGDQRSAEDCFEALWNFLFPSTPYAENPWAWLGWVTITKETK